jgi:signal transduction histidine kinase
VTTPSKAGSGTDTEELERLRAHVAQSAHDLSNALGAVLNYSAFIAEDLAGHASAQEYLPYLESAARRALTLVENLSGSQNPPGRED